jgi:carbamoylphosphate synthase small subunit
LSSGPDDPKTQWPETIATIKSWITSETIKPIFGIGLGHQVKILIQSNLFD